MSKRERLHVTVSPSAKRRLEIYCEQHDGITMGDVVDAALKNFFESQDREGSAPDIVLDRINQLLLSNMQIAQAIGQVKDTNKLLEGDLSDLREVLLRDDNRN